MTMLAPPLPPLFPLWLKNSLGPPPRGMPAALTGVVQPLFFLTRNVSRSRDGSRLPDGRTFER